MYSIPTAEQKPETEDHRFQKPLHLGQRMWPFASTRNSWEDDSSFISPPASQRQSMHHSNIFLILRNHASESFNFFSVFFHFCLKFGKFLIGVCLCDWCCGRRGCRTRHCSWKTSAGVSWVGSRCFVCWKRDCCWKISVGVCWGGSRCFFF